MFIKMIIPTFHDNVNDDDNDNNNILIPPFSITLINLI